MKKFVLTCAAIMAASLFVVAGANNSVDADLVNFKLKINGDTAELASPMVVIDGKTYAPVRELAEKLGVDVYWNNEEKKVSLFTENDKTYFLDDALWAEPQKDKITGEITELVFGKGDDVLYKTKNYFKVPLPHETLYFSEGITPIKDADGTWKYIDIAGNVVMSFDEFDYMGLFSEGLAPVSIKGTAGSLYGYINRFGELVIPCGYADAFYFHDGFARVCNKKDGSFYFINKQGGRAFGDKEFVRAYDFHEGFAIIQTKGTKDLSDGVAYSYIDTNGNISPEEYFQCDDFENGTADVTRMDNSWATIDKNFEVVDDHYGHGAGAE